MASQTAGSATHLRTLNQLSMLFHFRKTAALTGAVLRDKRVHWLPKTLFIGILSVLVIALVGGDAVAELVSGVLPLIGPVVGIPADATFDWLALGVAAYNLLKLFPAEIVGEHYDRLFRAPRRAR